MRGSRASRLATAAALALMIAGCPADADEAGEGGVALGLACDQANPCADGLLCVDGVCRVRPWPPDAAAADTAPGPIDIAVVGDTAVEEPDSASPLDVPDDNDTALADTAGPDDVGPLEDSDVSGTVEFFLGEHTALVDPSDDTLTLQGEQGAAAQLFVPAAGLPTTLEVLAADPVGTEGCGRYRPALWLPDAAAGGAIATEPAWQGDAVEVTGEQLPQEIALDGAPALPVGVVRAGLIYEGVCVGSARQPLLATDASGVLDQTWVWIDLGAAATWIDAATLQLSGRWAIRMAIEIPGR